MPLVGAEDGVDVVGQLAGHVQELALAGGLVVGDGRLDQVAGAVQFVAVLDVLPAILRLDEGVIGVEVAVGLLGGGDQVDDGVGPLLQLGVALVGQRVGDAFEDLVDVGVVVELRPSCLPVLQPGGDGEVLDAAGDLALAQVGLDGGGAVGAQARAPEGVGRCGRPGRDRGQAHGFGRLGPERNRPGK